MTPSERLDQQQQLLDAVNAMHRICNGLTPPQIIAVVLQFYEEMIYTTIEHMPKDRQLSSKGEMVAVCWLDLIHVISDRAIQ